MSATPSSVSFLVAATIAVLYAATASDATMRQAEGVADAVRHADLIVRGKVARRLPDTDHDFHYGSLEVSEVIYGDSRIQRLTLVLSYTSEDVICDVGDEGVFFLRAKPPGGPQQLMVGPTSGSPDHLAQLPFSSAFIAHGPDACWAQNNTFYVRNPRAGRAEPEAAAARRRALYEGVRDRLADEAARLRVALDRNAGNAARAGEALERAPAAAATTSKATTSKGPATAAAADAPADHAAADVALIAAWLTGADVAAGAAERPFGDARWLAGAGDPICYTDVEKMMLRGLRVVPYEFIKPRMELIRGGHHVSPAVLITRTVAEDPREGPQGVRQAEMVRKHDRNERYYFVEVAIGNLAWHWMKVGVYEADGKPKIEVLSSMTS